MSTANPRKQPASLRIILTGFLVLWVIMAAFPFLWTLWGSFKVEGDFFSKANWVYALTGESTRVETGGSFTGDGYYGAWVTEEFGRAVMNT